ncbi:hypothetical protein STEG23_001695 [Scotinomys teguina]
MKYSPTAAVLLQPPGSRNQESQHIRLSVLKAAVLVPPQRCDSQWGGTSRLIWKSHPLQLPKAVLTRKATGAFLPYKEKKYDEGFKDPTRGQTRKLCGYVTKSHLNGMEAL